MVAIAGGKIVEGLARRRGSDPGRRGIVDCGGAMMKTIHDICTDAVMWLGALSQADADDAVDTLVERIIAVLRRDPRMPPLIGEQLRLLLADAVAPSRTELGDLIQGKGDLDDAVEIIAEALSTEIAEMLTKGANHEPAGPDYGRY
jgi:hypothetical protein